MQPRIPDTTSGVMPRWIWITISRLIVAVVQVAADADADMASATAIRMVFISVPRHVVGVGKAVAALRLAASLATRLEIASA